MRPDQHTLFTKQEAARELRVCARTVENLMRARALSYLKVGRAVRIPTEAIQAYRASHTIRAVS